MIELVNGNNGGGNIGLWLEVMVTVVGAVEVMLLVERWYWGESEIW